MAPNVTVRSIRVRDGTRIAQGIEAAWESGQWVSIICTNGMVGCGAFDVALMEKHEQVIAVAHGSIDKHLVTCEDLLGAKISGVTKLARAFGIKEGMGCREAVDLLS